MVPQNEDMHLVLSSDAKPRLKWTPELHQRFVEAVNQLGGVDKATPKTLMRVMEIPGLTLYHLKSHLQKYRLGKIQQSQTSIENKQEDYKEIQSSDDHQSRENKDESHNPTNESSEIAQALQLQIEVQRKLHEHIEVQRHLQMRIEAHGKYLQSVLTKAEETLSGYSSFSSVGIELAKAELSRLFSMVNSGVPSWSISETAETDGSGSKDVEKKQTRSTICSMESSLTSYESCGRKEDAKKENETGNTKNGKAYVELPLMDIHPQNKPGNSGSCNKRSGSTVSDCICEGQPVAKRWRSDEQFSKFGLLRTLDLNSQNQNEIESGSKEIDLN